MQLDDHAGMGAGRFRAALARLPGLGPWASRPGRRSRAAALLAWLALSGAVAPAAGQFPRVSAAIGYGSGGLFSEAYVLSIQHSSSVGQFSSGLYAFDICYVTRGHLAFALRAHTLRATLGDGTEAGRLDLLPAMLCVGYRQPSLAGRLGGFFGAGAGIASARFVPAETIDHWQPWEGETKIDVSDDHPLAFTFYGGADVALTEDLSLEVTLASTFVDTEIAFEPVPYEGFVSEHAYRVKGRHLSIALGLRWWAELW